MPRHLGALSFRPTFDQSGQQQHGPAAWNLSKGHGMLDTIGGGSGVERVETLLNGLAENVRVGRACGARTVEAGSDVGLG
eukprot:364439-Chlamydomonas_euryale.AAC.4